jgi:hypothetical protein
MSPLARSRFHSAEYLFGKTSPGWAERYQTKQYSIGDPVVTAVCRMTGAFTLNEVAAPSPAALQFLQIVERTACSTASSPPIRSGYDEVGFVLLGSDHLLDLVDYERFLLQVCARHTPAPAWHVFRCSLRPSR